jgi:phosphoglycolate phosphatase-like HAD superfamily hydrolase
MDGTIFDNIPLYREIFEKIAFSFGIPRDIAGNFFYETGGMSLAWQYKTLFEKNGIAANQKTVEESVARFWRMKGENEALIDIFPGTKEFLRRMKFASRFLLATSGSKTSGLIKLMEKYGLSYDIVLGSDRIPKGDEHIKLFARHFKIDLKEFREKAIYVGDGPVDMQIAKRNKIFGIGIVGILTQKKLFDAGASAVVKKISQVAELLGDIDKN